MRYLRSGLASSSSQLQICVRLVKVKLSEACDPILGSAWPPAPISAGTSHSTLLRWLQAPNILDLDFEKALSGNVLVFCQSKNYFYQKHFSQGTVNWKIFLRISWYVKEFLSENTIKILIRPSSSIFKPTTAVFPQLSFFIIAAAAVTGLQ